MGSLIHSLGVAGKMNGKGLGGLLLHDRNAGLHEFWGHSFGDSGLTPLGALVYGDVNMTGVSFVKEIKAVVIPTFEISLMYELKRRGPRTVPWGTPVVTSAWVGCVPSSSQERLHSVENVFPNAMTSLYRKQP